ncbi:transglutaminase-like domain-containing protein [Anaerotalea alkaliphila]|uniref:Transglutaminase domain-containing protein n=1 Tax=Anaerotalea alkaliphila TaxID=2662126 RepID=A0A7X5HTQ4_9FIRM|nr:transglutaminase domain-containing protein [Anaerotalea alkaliphila]NDL66370.1 transglutaminase domain-containing protein [Anaerotalea alkaliphila]
MKKTVLFLGTFALLLGLGFLAGPVEAASVGGGAVPTVQTAVPEVPEETVARGYGIDFSKSDQGIVRVYFNTGTAAKVKLMVVKDAEQYVYNLKNGTEYVNFPLQMGDGTYTVSIFENTVDSKYRRIAGATAQVALPDPKAVYLQSVQEIDWTPRNVAILTGKQLLSNLEAARLKNNQPPVLTGKDVVNSFHGHVIRKIAYDYEKIKSLSYDYLPQIDKVLAEEKGICYDYSALLASMLRSQGVPTRMVKGYASTTDVYHAWNEIYLAAEDRWVVVDSTFDAANFRGGRAFNLEKATASYRKLKQY